MDVFREKWNTQLWWQQQVDKKRYSAITQVKKPRVGERQGRL
jgi:hypothetical protein